MSASEQAPRQLDTILTGLVMGESARWHAGQLWVADWGTQEILAVPQPGTSETVVRVPTAPCCFDWLPDGRLLIVSGQEGRLLRLELDGSLSAYANLAASSPYPWNEIAVDGRGNAYVNTIGFDYPEGAFAPGAIALVTPNGEVRQVADRLAFPNGMLVTPDNRTLIVAESYGNCLTAFEIAADGSLVNRRVWATLEGDYPDGICLDAEGAIWYADVPNQRCVRVREGGAVLETVVVGKGCFSCALGDAANQQLFIVAAEWGDAEEMEGEGRTGQVLAYTAPAPRAELP